MAFSGSMSRLSEERDRAAAETLANVLGIT
jgi:hypothetical protein